MVGEDANHTPRGRRRNTNHTPHTNRLSHRACRRVLPVAFQYRIVVGEDAKQTTIYNKLLARFASELLSPFSNVIWAYKG